MVRSAPKPAPERFNAEIGDGPVVLDAPSASALDGRRRKLRAEAVDTGFVATQATNVIHLTGARGMGDVVYADVPLWAVVPPEGQPTLVCSAMDLPTLAEAWPADSLQPYGTFHYAGDPGPLHDVALGGDTELEALRSAISKLDIGSEVIVDAVPRGETHDGLCAALNPHALRISDAPFVAARQRKDEFELVRLRAANVIAEVALYEALERVAEGISETELCSWIHVGMSARGATPKLGVVASGERSALPEPWPGERRLRRGDVIRFDIGCTVEGYHSDLSRTAVLGTPPDGVKDAYQALREGEQAECRAAKPGATATDLFVAAMEATRRSGLEEYERDHCGHGIGLEVYEPPLLREDDPTVLEESMTLCVETPHFVLGRYGLQVEDAVVITDGGCARLGHSENNLITIDP